MSAVLVVCTSIPFIFFYLVLSIIALPNIFSRRVLVRALSFWKYIYYELVRG